MSVTFHPVPNFHAEAATRGLLHDVEYSAVQVHTTNRRLSVPVGHVALRGDYSFHCSVRCSRTVATDAHDALATVGVADAEYRDALDRVPSSMRSVKTPGV
jgi:hypothetical protein